MKTAYKVAIVIGFILLMVSSANAQFVSGNKLASKWRAYQRYDTGVGRNLDYGEGNYFMGYITGVYDATYWLYNSPDGITVGQMCSIVGKYLDEHPEEWNEPAWVLVRLALLEAFPKSKSKGE